MNVEVEWIAEELRRKTELLRTNKLIFFDYNNSWVGIERIELPTAMYQIAVLPLNYIPIRIR